jgi:hypothetical protein
MKKSSLVTTILFTISLTVLGTGAWALTQSHQAAQIDALMEQIDSACKTPDAAACTSLLNQIEPGA